MSRKLRLPSPAMAVALAALFVALSGTAVAAGVPALAKRALVADNAKKLSGQTSAQLLATANTAAKAAAEAAAQQPGPASTIADLITLKTVSGGAFPPGSSLKVWDVACDSGQKVVGGGLSSDGAVATFDSYPLNATTWEVVGGNLGGGTANVTAYAVCSR